MTIIASSEVRAGRASEVHSPGELPPGEKRQVADVRVVPPPAAASAAVPFHYTQTESFPALLNELRASLLISTYQANKLLAVRTSGRGLSTLVRTFDRPMGLA